MTDRHTVDTITSDELDALYDRLADYESRITWHTTCGSCARILDSAIRETERRERAEAALAEARGQIERVRKVIAERQAEVSEREAGGMLPFGTPDASWCDAVTVTCARVQDALKVFPPPTPVEHQATGQPMIQAAKEAAGYTDSYQLPGRDSGPSVAEDRAHWDNKHAGEGP